MNFLVSSVLVFSLLSCTTIERKLPPKKAPPQTAVRLEDIKTLIKQGKHTLAFTQLNKLILENQNTDLSDDAHILAGDLSIKRHDYDMAYKYFLGVINSQYYSPLESYAFLKASTSLQKLGRLDESLALVQKGLSVKNIPLADATEFQELKFSLLVQLGDRLDAFQALSFLSKNHSDPNKRMSYRFKVFEFIESTLTPEEIYNVAKQSDDKEYRAHCYYRLGKSFFENREFSKAIDYLEEVSDLNPQSEIADKSLKIIDQIQSRKTVSPKTIGAVLPLSGKHKDVAYKTLRGLQLGLGIFGDNPSDFQLAVIDSEGNPDFARRAVERLITENHVIAIVGSLLSKTAVSVANKANELGVPSIALSQKGGITEVGDYVFRSALTSEMQVAELVRHAMEDKGLKKFAILYPNDNYGVEYTNLFWDHVLARGGKVVGVQTYDPKETDFRSVMARLVGKYYIEDRIDEYKTALNKWYSEQKRISSRTSPPDDLLPPVVDFDAIFIPDNTRAVGQVAPMLTYLDIQKTTLIGTNLWNTPSLVQRGQNLVEGSLFVDGLLSNDASFKNSDFYKEFFNTYGEAPGIFESQAYDAAILLRQIITSGATSRVEVKENLEKLTNFPGSMGNLNTNSRREIIRPLFRLGVVNGEIVNTESK
jgi:branched-chain amino acid transport system substrate-binding protein